MGDRTIGLAAPGNRWLESQDGGTTWSTWRTELAVTATVATSNFQSMNLWSVWTALLQGDPRFNGPTSSLFPAFDVCPPLPH